MNNEVERMMDWVAENAGAITHRDSTLIVGSVHDKKFRIFADDPPWAGFKGPNGWGKARACFTLEEFIEEAKD